MRAPGIYLQVWGNVYTWDDGLMVAPVYEDGSFPDYPTSDEWTECTVVDESSRKARAMFAALGYGS